MDTTAYTVRITEKAVRVHRASCKRQGDTVPLAAAPLDRLAAATPASCCKPKAADVEAAVAALATAAYQHELVGACTHPEGHEQHMLLNGECPWCGAVDASQRVDLTAEEARHLEETGNLPASVWHAAEDAGDQHSVAFPGPKRYWRVLGRYGAQALAASLGVAAQVDNDERTVTGPVGYTDSLLALWESGLAGYREVAGQPLADGETDYTRRRLYFQGFLQARTGHTGRGA